MKVRSVERVGVGWGGGGGRESIQRMSVVGGGCVTVGVGACECVWGSVNVGECVCVYADRQIRVDLSEQKIVQQMDKIHEGVFSIGGGGGGGGGEEKVLN